MAHRSTFSSIWTTALAALVALLAFLGFGGKAATAAAPVSASAVPATAAVRRPAVAARRTWRAMMRGGSLPPTIKQRIRAEAHGKTPAVRRSTTAAAMGAGSGVTAGYPTALGVDVAAAAAPAAVRARASRAALTLAA